jgi:hypothetical protein
MRSYYLATLQLSALKMQRKNSFNKKKKPFGFCVLVVDLCAPAGTI